MVVYCRNQTMVRRLVDKQIFSPSFRRSKKLEPAVKEKLFFLVNAVIRDAKTKKAYGHK